MVRARRDELILEGLRSYFEACVALNEFYKDIQNGCHDILYRHGRGLWDACQLKGAPKIVDFSEGKEEGGYSWIAAGAAIPEHYKGDLQVALWWDYKYENPGAVKAAVGVTMEERFRDVWPVYDAAARGRVHRIDEWNGIFLWERVAPDDAHAWEATLDHLVAEWTELWRALGGLPGIRKRTAKA